MYIYAPFLCQSTELLETVWKAEIFLICYGGSLLHARFETRTGNSGLFELVSHQKLIRLICSNGPWSDWCVDVNSWWNVSKGWFPQSQNCLDAKLATVDKLKRHVFFTLNGCNQNDYNWNLCRQTRNDSEISPLWLTACYTHVTGKFPAKKLL